MTRVGVGYDSHRFASGDGVTLAGVRIAADVSLVGHSDADAVAHAVTDAILGAASLGDIGTMYPDTDPANRARDSMEMLGAARRRLESRGWKVGNVDVTVVAEVPRLGAHRDRMAQLLAVALGVAPEDVSVKGKTNEGMGWVGRREGLAVIAVATVRRA